MLHKTNNFLHPSLQVQNVIQQGSGETFVSFFFQTVHNCQLMLRACRQQAIWMRLFFFSSGLRPIAAQKVNVSTICFLVGNDHCTENCCRCANFFFSQKQQQQLQRIAPAAICCSCADGGVHRIELGSDRPASFVFLLYSLQTAAVTSKAEFCQAKLNRKPFFCQRRTTNASAKTNKLRRPADSPPPTYQQLLHWRMYCGRQGWYC